MSTLARACSVASAVAHALVKIQNPMARSQVKPAANLSTQLTQKKLRTGSACGSIALSISAPPRIEGAIEGANVRPSPFSSRSGCGKIST